MNPRLQNVASPSPDSSSEAELIAQLQEVVGEAWVLTSLPDRIAYARDCWPQGIILVRGGTVMLYRPSCIVQPADEAEVAAVIAVCRAAKVPLVP